MPTKPVSSTTTNPRVPQSTSTPIEKTSTTTKPRASQSAPTEKTSTSFRDIILVKSAPTYAHEPDPPTQVSAPSPPQLNGIPTKGDTGRQPQLDFQTTTKLPFTLKTLLTEKPQRQILKTDGLPPPVEIKPKYNSADEPNNLLYTFNYTAGFHGHHEDGYRNGDKAGDYFVNGRDGVSRRVDYIANEFGYQPNITITKLNDENRPKEETEKSFGLKGYEFKWFYRK